MIFKVSCSHQEMLLDLTELIESKPDPRELKRAVAVKMFMSGYKHREIQESLSVSSGFISKWTAWYQLLGVTGIRLGYSGSVGYLSEKQQQATIDWLQSKDYWNLTELRGYIQDEYEIVFASKQSYYTLFEAAGISWKKTQKINPKSEPKLVQKKTGDYRMARAAPSPN
jgi:putative transposase